MRLLGKTAVVVGAGQSPGETVGNGRAAALLFAREGAEVACVDRDGASARETVALIQAAGGRAHVLEADITAEAACAAMIADALSVLGRIDVLHNNVGIGAGDAPAHRLETDVWDRILTVNLRAMWLTIKHALPAMRASRAGAIVNISSLAAVAPSGLTAYEISKAGVNKLTTNIAAANARYGIRCNAIMPGFMDTPMAVDAGAAARGVAVADYRAARDSMVPLGGRMGTGWDTAHAALFLASDEARFITGAILPVDGGQGLFTA